MNIPDRNMRLTLLQALWWCNVVPIFDKPRFYREVLGEPFDPRAPYNDSIDKRLLDAILAEPLTPELLAQVKMVVWDGSNPIHNMLWTNWTGEDTTFDVHDLRGLEACVNVEQIQFTGGCRAPDLSPVAGLAHLRELTLLDQAFRSPEALETLPSLKTLAVLLVDSPATQATIAKLAAAGVDVSRCGIISPEQADLPPEML